MENAVNRKQSSSSAGPNVRRQAFAASPPSYLEGFGIIITFHVSLPPDVCRSDFPPSIQRAHWSTVIPQRCVIASPLWLIALNSPLWFLLTASVRMDSGGFKTLASRRLRICATIHLCARAVRVPPSRDELILFSSARRH